MKLSKLVERLKKIQKDLKIDPDVVIDFDENGWYELDKVQVVSDADDVMINLKSSNEI